MFSRGLCFFCAESDAEGLKERSLTIGSQLFCFLLPPPPPARLRSALRAAAPPLRLRHVPSRLGSPLLGSTYLSWSGSRDAVSTVIEWTAHRPASPVGSTTTTAVVAASSTAPGSSRSADSLMIVSYLGSKASPGDEWPRPREGERESSRRVRMNTVVPASAAGTAPSSGGGETAMRTEERARAGAVRRGSRQGDQEHCQSPSVRVAEYGRTMPRVSFFPPRASAVFGHGDRRRGVERLKQPLGGEARDTETPPWRRGEGHGDTELDNECNECSEFREMPQMAEAERVRRTSGAVLRKQDGRRGTGRVLIDTECLSSSAKPDQG
ncbi:hypothetical protein THAOC_23983 [Thalassiosira oceanica]|uniref:Uncharacterized protein n=1 Tax=Thalassiosira oceanica TaxID=159749 RepID=K0RR29_THAOC|nr:hypothetical protein THAOC_23983 [Thalassiosira oceanica]|eukprot:EJK56183.1 hypothetical protein THAOC_23983 [Thalassiosira oceanica]